MDSTLLLNTGFEPIKIIAWQRAITLLFLGKVEVIDEYDREVRSVSVAFRMPAVVRLLRYVKFTKRKPPLTRVNLLARDNFQCQYCGEEMAYRDSSIDHVVPRSQGGGTSWKNVVISCHPCNRKKGGRTPHEARMKLLQDPYEPEWLPVLNMRFHRKMPEAWLAFFGDDDPETIAAKLPKS